MTEVEMLQKKLLAIQSDLLNISRTISILKHETWDIRDYLGKSNKSIMEQFKKEKTRKIIKYFLKNMADEFFEVERLINRMVKYR